MVVVCALGGVSVASAGAALPEGRVYEQVSPGFKAGYPVFVTPGTSGAALDGESFFFSSVGAFSGSGEDFALNPYVARRTADGWVTAGLYPPPIEGELLAGFEEMSPELSMFEYQGSPVQTASERLETPSGTLWVRGADGSLGRVSPVMTTADGTPNSMSVVGAASDLSRFVLDPNESPNDHILPGDETQGGRQLLEAEGSSLRLVAVDDSGKQLTRYCGVALGAFVVGGVGAVSQPGASKVFFSVPIDAYASNGGGCDDDPSEPGNPANPIEVFVRVDGARTLRVSEPLAEECTEEPCAGAAVATPMAAVFQGASEDGSRVYFTTAQPLVNGDKDHSNDLYMARIGTSGLGEPAVTSLTQVSHDPNVGKAAEVESHVVAVSRDGSHVYFVARGVLAAGANGEGEAAVAGAENLYVYDANAGASGTVSFVADLCSGPGKSGAATDTRCPGSSDEDLWNIASAEHQEAQTTTDGDFLVFSTYAQLIDRGPEADTDTARDVYRYDALTGGIQRVSLGENGVDGNGNDSAFDASITPAVFHGSVQEQYELGSRAISDDGSRIVFTTSEPLSNDAINGLRDVYVWHEGRVGLISSGSATEADAEPVITPSGRDIFFMTSAGLVPGDTDGLRDVYDARIGGGFPAVPASSEECSGDGCQGPLSAPAPAPVAGSIAQPAGGNLPPPPSPSPAAPVAKAKTKAKKSKKPKTSRGRGGARAKRKAKKGARGARGSATGGRRGQ
jgi:hypothetical protein